MKKTVVQIILEYLEGYMDWEYGGRLEDYVRSKLGSKASNTSRRCREMVDERLIQVQYVQINGKGAHVTMYKFIKKPVPSPYKVQEGLFN